MFGRRRAALLLLVLLQAAHCVGEPHSSEQRQRAADEGGQEIDARDSIVGISATGVEPEVRRTATGGRQVTKACALRVATVALQALLPELEGQRADDVQLADDAPPSVYEKEYACAPSVRASARH